MKSIVDKINLQKYLPFFTTLDESGHALIICNYIGKQLLIELSDSQLQSDSKILEITNLLNWEEAPVNESHLFHEHNAHIFFSTLILGANQHTYWLVGLQQSTFALSQQQIKHQNNKLQHISSCLVDDFNQKETVFGMAEELSVRYEELNLLYGMDEIEAYKNNDEEKALQKITQNCVDYLNIDYAAIYIPDRDFFFYLHGHNENNLDEIYLQEMICQQLNAYLTSNPTTLVINQNNQIDWTDASINIPNKLIAAPLYNANHSICGLLVLMNSLQNLDFSNSDRKLTEVLADEGSKLIQARRDPVTEQLNRQGFTERLERVISEQRLPDDNNCLLVVNLDQFKVINDTVGLKGGDHLLRQITAIILKNLKTSDILSRLGADEFSIILKQCSLEYATDIAQRIRLAIKQFRFLYQDKMFDISACLGVVELNEEIKDHSQALSAADLACSVAKEQGRDLVHTYKPTDELLLKHEDQILWVSRIHLALEEDLFQIYRQKIELLHGDPEREEHYEILIRLKQKNGEILSPFHFIPAAEHYNLMPKIDRWVIKKTFQRMALEFKNNPDSKLICSINLSGQSISEGDFSIYIQDQLKVSGVPVDRICLEITETVAVSNLTKAVQFMEELKAIGFHFSLDDFGSGMSSFTYLKNLPVDYLKIDGYFVKTMLENKIDKAMVIAIHQIANVMGLKTIAEFVENDDIMDQLRDIGVNYGQGYGIHKPEHFI